MAQVQQRLLAGLLALGVLATQAPAKKFYPDDPLQHEPPPLNVEKANPRKISDYYDFFLHIFGEPGEKNTLKRAVPAQDVNTLGEVLEGPWYEQRHARRRMTLDELAAGAGNRTPPADGVWTVVSAKSEGVTPGFRIQDSAGRQYLLKFDPIGNPEMATAADVVTSRIFHALGYHVPQYYVVHFERSRLEIKSGATFRDSRGIKRTLTPKDVGEILLKAPRQVDGRYRASASLFLAGQPLNEFRYFGTRADDPNDIVPHEHRRVLRGLHVFCAWVNHEDSRAINTLDTLVEENGVKFVKHHLIDFGSTLGSASTRPNSPRSGFEQLFTWRSSAAEFLSLGLYVPKWATIDYPEMRSVGRFSARYFDPVRWTPEYPNPAFDNRLPDDTFWAARQVMAFTDEDIRAIVKTGAYSDPLAEKYVADTLIARRDAIGRAYLSRPLALDEIRVDGGSLKFTDLAVKYGFAKHTPEYLIRWSRFENETGKKSPLEGTVGATLPVDTQSDYLTADITAGDERRYITVYFRRSQNSYKVVGIDRVL